MEINAATLSELLRRLAGTAQDTSAAVGASQAAVSQLSLLLRPATASEGSDLEQAHQGWHDQLGALSASRMVRARHGKPVMAPLFDEPAVELCEIGQIPTACTLHVEVVATMQEHDKRRAAELIALTAQECSSHTFLCSWAAWGAATSGMIQAEQPPAVCAAAWTALSHIIARSDIQALVFLHGVSASWSTSMGFI